MDDERIEIIGKDGAFPYSRGILARSLRTIGLDVDQSYDIAEQIQHALSPGRQFTTEELQNAVCELLSEKLGEEIAAKYREIENRVSEQMVEGEASSFPFSKGILTNSIAASGLDHNTAYAIARDVQDHLLHQMKDIVSRDELRKMTYGRIVEECDPASAERYLVWRSIGKLKKPLVILIGGGTGSGKSTTAVELAHRLGISSVNSTDSIREIMRTMFSEKLMPFIYKSSYDAWQAADVPPEKGSDPVIAAFLEQTLRVKVGIEGMIKRAAKENVHLIINGVHILPGLIIPEEFEDAHVVMFVTAIGEEDSHKERFESREIQSSDRLASRYLENLDSIRKIQAYIIKMAKRHGVPVLDSPNLDRIAFEALLHLTDFVKSRPGFEMAKI